MTKLIHFSPEKKVLKNGLTILVRPCHTIPRVEAHILYKVGSKDEESGQKGIAHFIEHMLFKGTKKLSETDINLIAHKLTGEANAFTSHDYTGYTFRLPSNSWEAALMVFAECMQNARFDEQMIASEIQTVIEELRMYRDDYINYVVESVIASMWPEHPYHSPVIGSHYDLCALTRKNIVDFYHTHYHPGNATLVIVGDVKADDAFRLAEKYFDHIPTTPSTPLSRKYFHDDIASKSTTVYRHINTPWCCCMYQIPGSHDGKNHLYDIATLVLGNGKSSRLYRRLVDKERVAIDVDCMIMSFFEKSIFSISYYPNDTKNIPAIEKMIEEEIELLSSKPIKPWEFQGVTKKAQFDYSTLLENMERQATIIGTSYLATGNENFLNDYFERIKTLTQRDLQNFFQTYLNPRVNHKGYLLPLDKRDQQKAATIQQETEAQENEILKQYHRTTPIEPGRFVNTLTYQAPTNFSFPKPSQFILDNGLEVVYYDNPTTPNIAMLLKVKANPLYDEPGKEGEFLFLLRLLTDSSAKHSSQKLNQLLESNGIFITPAGDCFLCQCLSQDFPKALEILSHLITTPSFKQQTIEKIKIQTINELTDFWDTPVDYIDQITRQIMYQDHPYARPNDGSPVSIKSITAKDLKTCYKKYITPHDATLIIVGDVSNYQLKKIIPHYFSSWQGPIVEKIQLPSYIEPTPQTVSIPAKRDQVVIAFAAPSITRTDENFHYLALLDIILTGGAIGSTNSRLFQLREKTGLFYTIGGSLIHGSREAEGLLFIKTIVSCEKVAEAKKLILNTLDELGKQGITQEEFSMAKNIAIASSIELFENNINIAQTLLFLKRFNLNYNLFDKQSDLLSILNIDKLQKLAKQYCNHKRVSVITVGRAAA